LRLGHEHRFTAIAFPAISTGVYGYPRAPAAQIAVTAVAAHLNAHDRPERVIFVCFDPATRAAYEAALAGL
jgi:O-acetyl-ADP-ribose deacetylase (regulator of RNase III)